MTSFLARLCARLRNTLKISLMSGSDDQVPAAINNNGITGDLTYKIPRAKLEELACLRSNVPEAIYWDLDWYKNDAGKRVRVSYSDNIADSEALAQRFLGEFVIGFDMEWKPQFKKGQTHEGIKNNVSLIQMARDGEVGLFHIAQHKGSTISELFAPSLLKVIRNSGMIKTGVNIYGADARQLKQYAGIDGKGFLELSHLHQQIIDHESGLENGSICRRKKLHGLAKQLEMHLGFRLRKGAVRTSDWTKPLTVEMRQYAAADAYAGLILFHTINAKRLNLNPTPPLPQFAEDSGVSVPDAKAASKPAIIRRVPGSMENENRKWQVVVDQKPSGDDNLSATEVETVAKKEIPRLRVPPPLDVAVQSLKTVPNQGAPSDMKKRKVNPASNGASYKRSKVDETD